jgi:hypothetical protein
VVGVYLKKLDILPVPCEYIFSLMMFTVNNLDSFQTNSTVNLSCIHKGVFYSSVKIFNSLSPCILKLKQEKPKFKVPLRECLIAHTFYSLDEFLSTSQIAFRNIINFTYSN